jgi:hypothetical protein
MVDTFSSLFFLLNTDDIEYLYQINVSPGGKILKTPPTDEVLAKKREEKEYQRKLLERKRAGADIIAKDVEELEPLSMQNTESQQACTFSPLLIYYKI